MPKVSLSLPAWMLARLDALRADPQAQGYQRSRSALIVLLLERELLRQDSAARWSWKDATKPSRVP